MEVINIPLIVVLTIPVLFTSDTLIIDSLTTGNYYLMVKDDSSCVNDYGNVFLGRTPNPKIDSAEC